MRIAAVDAALAVLIACVPASTALAATVKPPALGCESFMRDFPAAATGHRVSFERPLTISRGFGEALSGVDVRVLASDTKVDGTLKCRGDEFLRFEIRATLPADPKVLADLDRFEQAALMAAFRWDRPKAETVQKAMGADATEYLRASVERGDTYNAGKVEYHQADRLDLGLIYTQSDHTFVVALQNDD